jgi:ribosomal protein S20
MENRPKKEQERRKANKANISTVKTFLKKIRNEGNKPAFESAIRRVGKRVFHANKISRLISSSISHYRGKNGR